MPPKSRKRARRLGIVAAVLAFVVIAYVSSSQYEDVHVNEGAAFEVEEKITTNSVESPPSSLVHHDDDSHRTADDAEVVPDTTTVDNDARRDAVDTGSATTPVASSSSSSSSSKPVTPAERRRSLKLSGFVPLEHFEANGDVVKWGQDHIVADAAACHDACVALKDKGCNAWVFCPSEGGCGSQKYKCCWLKKQARPWTLLGGRGAHVPWTSGGIYEQDDPTGGDPDPSRKFHVVLTTNNAVYQAWQARVMYYHYKKQKALQGPNGQMGGFTRILHDSSDGLEDEIPTCRVDRLQDEMGFVVLSRPWAFEQFFAKCPEIEEDYILMAEPDHLYIKPIPNLMRGNNPAAFPFFYIVPHDQPDILRRFLPGITDEEMFDIDPIGSSPTFIHKNDLKRLAPVWNNMSVALQSDPPAKKAWGWVIEMYGYTLAAYKMGIAHDLRPQLQSQPPWDTEIGDFLSIHFTYGMDYDASGKATPGKVGEWRFDKRSYSHTYPPKHLPAPPAGMKNDLVRVLIDAINEASAALPNWGMYRGNNITGTFH